VIEGYPGQSFWHEHNPRIRRAEERFERRNMAITKAQLENWFTYHSPSKEQLPKYEAIRNAGLNLAEIIVENSPPSADQTAAVRKVREACFTANAAIACQGE
jgi:hypothetical protein